MYVLSTRPNAKLSRSKVGRTSDLQRERHVRTVHEKRRGDHACPHCAAVFGGASGLLTRRAHGAQTDKVSSSVIFYSSTYLSTPHGKEQGTQKETLLTRRVFYHLPLSSSSPISRRIAAYVLTKPITSLAMATRAAPPQGTRACCTPPRAGTCTPSAAPRWPSTRHARARRCARHRHSSPSTPTTRLPKRPARTRAASSRAARGRARRRVRGRSRACAAGAACCRRRRRPASRSTRSRRSRSLRAKGAGRIGE